MSRKHVNKETIKQTPPNQSEIFFLRNWDVFEHMLQNRNVPGWERRMHVAQCEHEWLEEITKSDAFEEDSEDEELWADLPPSTDEDEEEEELSDT